MSLLGRLEDLSLTDIIQIVFLSRRTGVLEIINESGRHTVLFRHGLVVNAAAPDAPDLAVYLEQRGSMPPGNRPILRQMEENGIAFGTSALELNLISKEMLADAIRVRISEVVTPLLQSREGEFNFILSETMSSVDMEYDPDALFKEGGFPPQKILGADGEKLKPLRGLEESLKAGKALLRGAATPEPPAVLDLGVGSAPEPAADDEPPFGSPERFTPPDDLPPAEPEPPPPAPAPVASPDNVVPFKPQGKFKVAGGLFEVESPDAVFRNVVVYERNPLIRVAAKRAFAKKNARTTQFGNLDDVHTAIQELFRSNSFFVTFLEITKDDASLRLLQQIKRKNPRLPVVMVDATPDLRRRHELLRNGADLYLTKPSSERLQPGLAEEELTLFADELVLFAERAFDNWERTTGDFGAEAGKRFYEIGGKESLERSFGALKQLINELSNPNDIEQVATTILRLSAQYLDRAALFMVGDGSLAGLGAFAAGGVGDAIEGNVRAMRFRLDEPSVLADVAATGNAHRGKIRKTPANVRLMEGLGGKLPTEVVVLPIVHAAKTIGILYGDNAEHRGPIDGVTGLEIFLSQAGYAFGNAVFASQQGGGRDGT